MGRASVNHRRRVGATATDTHNDPPYENRTAGGSIEGIDFISSLPVAILHLFLSSIPKKPAITTSVLCNLHEISHQTLRLIPAKNRALNDLRSFFDFDSSFAAERVGLPYLSAYLNFRHGANFATGGSTIRRQNETIFQYGISPFSLDMQNTDRDSSPIPLLNPEETSRHNLRRMQSTQPTRNLPSDTPAMARPIVRRIFDLHRNSLYRNSTAKQRLIGCAHFKLSDESGCPFLERF